MPMVQKSAAVLEQESGIGAGFRNRPCRRAIRFEQFVDSIRFGIADLALLARGPEDFDFQSLLGIADREDPGGIIAGKIPSATDHLLLLNEAALFDANASANAARIGFAAQPDLNAIGGCV